MLTSRINPAFSGLASRSLLPEVGRLVDMFFPTLPIGESEVSAVSPAMNIFEDEHAFIVEAELPGFAMSDLDIGITAGELTIAGKREVAPPKDVVVHQSERPTAASFKRVVRFSTSFDVEKATATLDAGVLTITLPKAESVKPRRIQVTGN